MDNKSFKELEFKIIKEIKVTKDSGDDSIVIKFEDGSSLEMCHEQDCCESVWIEDIESNKNLSEYKGAVVIDMYVTTAENTEASESGTYTFYNLNTSKGSINIRWNGESNSYYSEEVSTCLYGSYGNKIKEYMYEIFNIYFNCSWVIYYCTGKR